MSLDEVSKQILEWQRETFGDKRTLAGAAGHLEKEVAEVKWIADALVHYGIVRKNDDDKRVRSLQLELMEECADCLFMLLQIADVCGFSLAMATAAKLEKNKQRKWKAPDESGVIEHVKGEDE